MMAKKTATIKRYTVLIPCRNDATAKQFQVGDIVKDGDFPAAVIQNWLKIGVLADGSDTKR